MIFTGRLLIVLMLLITATIHASQEKNTDNRVVHIAVDDIPLSFYPYGSQAVSDNFTHLFFDPLIRWTGKHQLELRLLEKWKVIKPGIIRFYLKKNIHFHSGNSLSSKDVIWTYQQILKNPQKKEFFKAIKKIKRNDKNSFDLYTDTSQSQLFDYLTHFFVLDSDFYSTLKVDLYAPLNHINLGTNKLFLSGTGPYKIKEYNAALQLRVMSNGDYPLADVPIKSLDFIKIKSAKSRLFALLAHDVDISTFASSKNTVSLESKSLYQVNAPNALFLTINSLKSDVFRKVDARNAIHLLINQEGMLKHILNGMGSINTTFTPQSSIETAVLTAKRPEYDIKRSKYLLAHLNVPKDLTLLLLTDDDHIQQVANALKNMMNRAGLRLAITLVNDKASFKQSFLDYDFTLSAWQSSLMNTDNINHSLFNNSHLAPYFSGLFADKKALNNQSLLFANAQREHQIIPLFSQNEVWASDQKYNLSSVFSINGIAYWHLLTAN